MVRQFTAFIVSLGFHFALVGSIAISAGALALGEFRSNSPTGQPASAEPAPLAVADVEPDSSLQQEPELPAESATPSQPDFGAWRYRCDRRDSAGIPLCSITQAVVDPRSKSVLLIWRIARNGNGNLVSTLQTPTDVETETGLVISIDAARNYRIPFEQCYSTGCLSEANLAPDFARLLADAKDIAVTVFTLRGRGVRVAFDARGLAKGISTLTESDI